MKRLVLLVLTPLFVLNCTKDFEPGNTSLGRLDYDYKNVPPNRSMYTHNLSNEAAILGRVLFYDKNLSLNNAVSCSSCHLQELGFADNKTFSVGFENKRTTRNSSHIVNSGIQSGFFWDMRAITLNDLISQPIQNHIEMGMEDLDYLTQKLQNLDYYKPLFEDAFGTSVITEDEITFALESFLRSIVSVEARIDQLIDNNYSDEGLSAQEINGKEVFEKHCISCHNGYNLGGNHWANIGLPNSDLKVFIGWVGEDGVPASKVPSLRNVMLTAPYMHDGRFNTLREVLNHYSSGVEYNEHLSWQFLDMLGQVKNLEMTEQDKDDLIEFLKLTTDYSMISDPKFSNPFRSN